MQSFVSAIEKRLKFILQLKNEQKNQKLAIQTALKNSKQHFNLVREVFENNRQHILEKHKEYERIFQNVETYLQRVKKSKKRT
jgi:ABC-type transporter lipoprotein component MlaA